jgi:ATP-binding cassette, subfamily B, bacterial PglK
VRRIRIFSLRTWPGGARAAGLFCSSVEGMIRCGLYHPMRGGLPPLFSCDLRAQGEGILLTTIRQALYLMGRETRRRWWLLLALAVAVSLMEIIAAAMIYMLLGLVANPDGEMNLPLIGDVRELAGGIDERTLLLSLIGIMIAFFIVRGVALIGAEYIQSRVVQQAAARLSTKLVRGYLGLPFTFHLQRNSAELIRNSHQATLDLAGSAFYPLIRISAEAVLVVGILVLLVLVSPLGAAMAVVVVGGTSALLLFIVQPRLKRFGLTAHAMHKETLRSLQQSFDGVRDIKVLGREDVFSNVYSRSRRRLARMLYVRTALYQLPSVAMETALIGFILIFFAVTVARGSGGQDALSILGLFGYAGLRLQPSLKTITGGLNSLKFAAAPTADLHRDLRLIEQQPVQRKSSESFPFEREIRLDGVRFRYDETDCDALADVDVAISRGEQIGICGPTGGGKSTMVDIIVGLLAPTAGRVLVDGRDIASNTGGWQRNLGMVPQMVFLIDDTVTHNIALGVADADVDKTALEEAIHLAQLDDFIGSLPKGLDTVVGEHGVRVSGGQRQRIAIARALYNRPEVLIFDEGTSALDNTTEQELMQSLRQLRGAHTILLVAHRLSTVRDADRVIFVNEGRVAGIDTFEGLRNSNPAFREMATTS